MAIMKLPEFAKEGQKNTDDLDQEKGFPVNIKPARQWFNYLFNNLTKTINQVIDEKVDVKKSFIDAFGSDVDYYQDSSTAQIFSSVDEFPLGSRCLYASQIALKNSPVFPDQHIYVETKATYKKDMPGKIQLAYGYTSGSIAVRSAGTNAPYSNWNYVATLASNVASASKLQNARTVSFSGAATGSFSYDGSGNSSCVLTLANSGVEAGTYSSSIMIPSISVNAKGQIVAISQNAIRAASTTQSGVVQLVDNLVTKDATKALTAAQGAVLNDTKMDRGEFGFGSASKYSDRNPAATADRVTLEKTQMYSFVDTGRVSYGQGLGWSVGAPDRAKAHFILGGFLNNELYHVAVDDISKPAEQRTVFYNCLYSTAHAEFDRKGYLRRINQNTDTVITTDINRYSQALYETKLFSPNATKYFYVTDNDFGMWNTATNETVPLAPRCGGTGRRDGNIDGNAATASVLKATDERSLRPGNVTGGALKFSFSTLSGNNQAADFCDLLSLNSYVDGSGGFVNALALGKYDHQIWHYQGNFGADTWSAKRRLAYVDENVASASKLQNTRTVSFSGAATGSFSYDGSGNSSCVLTLANSGVEAGTYASTIEIPSITVNQKGQVTGISKQPIRSASVTQTGVVQLVDDLTTDDSTKALTAKQGKKLYDTLNQMANKPDIRACVSFNSISNQFINNFGFTSVTNLGGGLFEFTLSTPVPDANYSIFTTVSQFREATSATIDTGFSQTTTKFRIRCLWGGDNTTGSFNPAILNIHITY